ncbi:hypothetical protein M409DRAFT_70507 [Zasmidium cellare ATCC 36951]|uniref:NAD(P)-binding protein n=1 Tax=Zasmidium cellare ATCC 36951 TaxID=1080233 RepID=A0A6A6BZW4_ZASCE|nr:uncharacterized protein M409DRAFT_70507 [Zasmidium cellare ATCC 36951]KAF2160344.1 hypothetical protein M409DRAFT_70507 [Zasmidium cellare ATCC 36951]
MPPPKVPYQPYADVHQTPAGPGDARPTALQIIEDNDLLGKLTNKTVLITGGSSGIGVTTAAAFYETGAKVLITARDMPKVEKVIDDIVHNSPSKDKKFPRPEAIEAHLDNLQSVRDAAKVIKSKVSSLNILINNAGIAFIPYSKTVDGFELGIGTNHFSHFLLFQELKPLLLAGAKECGSTSRVINISSAAHRRSAVHVDDIIFEHREYDLYLGYGQSKTANIWMANALTRKYGAEGLTGLSVHPGVIATDLGRHMSQKQIDDLIARNQSRIKSLEQGAATTVWAAVSPHFEDVANGGRYLADVGEAGTAGSNHEAYSPHAYDEDGEDKLWKLSCKAVGVDED